MSKFRIGYGEDIHRLVEGRSLILGGVKIPYEKGLLGHSDADVIFHALSDALLGSLALGDIGVLYPPSDPSTEGIDSSLILTRCAALVKGRGYSIGNIDIMVIAEKPHLSGYILAMRKRISEILAIDVDDVSIKAGTNEGLDEIGKGEAIKAIAIVLVNKE